MVGGRSGGRSYPPGLETHQMQTRCCHGNLYLTQRSPSVVVFFINVLPTLMFVRGLFDLLWRGEGTEANRK